MRVVHWVMAFCFFTASCDIVLTVNLGGEVRAASLAFIFICIASFARVMQDARILWPRGSTCLCLWLLSQVVFLPLSGELSFGLRALVFLIFTIMCFFAVVQLYGNSDRLPSLMRLYLLSYVAIALFGLLQFATPLVGLPGILVQQWILHGKVARINGFMLEPSYYATYLTMGWIMLVELRLAKAKITEGRLWKIATALVTLSLLLSTSKTAWVFMIVEGLARLAPEVWRGFRNIVWQIRRGQMRVPLPRPVFLLKGALLVVVVIGSVSYFSRLINPLVLLGGSGLANTPAHSVNIRRDQAYRTLETFLDAPFIGHSLGGVPIVIAARSGVQVRSVEEFRLYWGFPVFLEVLVASGIIGAIPFFLFVYANTIGAMKTARRYWPLERAKWLRALARAMIYECLLLMVDQNMLRVYVWIHLSMVAVIAYNVEFGTTREGVVADTGPSVHPSLEALSTA
jgi:hypothetical protein